MPAPECERKMQEFNMDPRTETALRGMMTSTDERYQALSARVAGMEDNLLALTNATRELRAAISRGAAITVEGGSVDAAGIGEIKDHLDDLERHLAAAFDHLAQRESARDAALVAAIEERVHEETIRVSAETHQKVEALEAVVRDAASGEISLDGVQLAAPPVDTDALIEAFEERVVRLAALVRSDSMRIAEKIDQQVEQLRLETAQMLESRMGRVSELVSATTMSAVAEVARQVPEQTLATLDEKVGQITTRIDENFVELADTTETEMHRMGRYLSERTAELVDAAIAGRLTAVVDRINDATAAIESSAAGTAGLGEAAMADLQGLVDDRITALAKMIRSDNSRLAEVVEVAAQQEAAKQATRAVKELAASLPAHILEVVDRRFAQLSEDLHRETQSTVVSMAKVGDVLSERMGEMEGRYETGVERAAEKLGDAVINALAGRRV